MATLAHRKTCFVDMPFGRKADPKSGVEIDFDQIYRDGIAPAIEDAGLNCIRGDQENTGGIIHTAMFARLLLAEFVVADMTAANPNVFYELGVRHAAKPYTTIPLFATIGTPPFDVGMVRAIPYELVDGRLTEATAAALKQALTARIRAALDSPVAQDSPLFQLFDHYPGITMSHELTDVFRDRVAYSQDFKAQLAAARARQPADSARQALRDIEASLGDIAAAERGVVVDLLLSYRAAEDHDGMLGLVGRMSGDVRAAALVRQQQAFALNRRKQPGDVDRAVALLEALRAEQGDSAETLGLLGRIYKDRFKAAQAAGKPDAPAWLDEAIATYTRGFEAEPLDFYPGVNALTLLVQKQGAEADAEIDRLLPLVTFAVVRRGAEKSSDYWTVASALEVGCIGLNEALAQRCKPRAIMLALKANERWMLKTTADNLALLATRWAQNPQAAFIAAVEGELRTAAAAA